jgi:hypothetical protein
VSLADATIAIGTGRVVRRHVILGIDTAWDKNHEKTIKTRVKDKKLDKKKKTKIENLENRFFASPAFF